ncbi:unnamed protein product [Rotaria sordida]|uniref:FLYWCH-type domain-containing protein n=1 Tax=Rotaria sordida TaxID=392033 RepID=A0A815U1G9_9BILA|nr:unnamed protein product [Rotaria sordida]
MVTISTFGTTKRKPLLDYNGHSYVKDRSTTEKIYCRCSRYSIQHCRSRLHTCILTNNIVKPPTEHSCTFDGTTLELRKFDQQLIDRAKSTQEAPDMIVTNCIKGMSDQAVSRLPIRDNIKRRIRKIRSKNDYTAVPNDPNFLSIPSALCKTQRNSQFLRSDTGPGDDRILIFASDEQLGILQSAHHFMSDGTFKVVPESLGWQTQYQTDSVFAHNIHKFGALAFLSPNDVIKGFESLSLNLDDEYQDMIDYFEETYIGKLSVLKLLQ